MPLTQTEFDYVRTLVRQRAAIVIESDKLYRAEIALAPLARQEGCATVEELVGRLRVSAVNGVHHQAVEAMTINETSFFRDLYPFEALRKVVLPDMMKRRAAERRLDIWCAACSTGQEPYSVAMVCRDSFPSLSEWTVRIVASDLSSVVLEKARAGVYSQLEVNRGLAARHLLRFFQKQGLQWQINEEVHRLVEFRPINLIESWPLTGSMDIVFLRNILIYFDEDTKKRVLKRVSSLLRPGGVLFLGGAETTLNLSADFERVAFEKHSYYRTRER